MVKKIRSWWEIRSGFDTARMILGSLLIWWVLIKFIGLSWATLVILAVWGYVLFKNSEKERK